MNLPSGLEASRPLTISEAAAKTLTETITVMEPRPLMAKLNDQRGSTHIGAAVVLEGTAALGLGAALLFMGINTVKNMGGELPSANPRDLLPSNPGHELAIPSPIRPTRQEYATATATREPTSTAIATATVSPTTTPTHEPTKIPLPKENPTSLTDENFSQFVRTVSQEEFNQLAKSQPDAFAFPAKPLSGDISITYTDQAATASTDGHLRSININGSNYLIIRPKDGELVFNRTYPPQKDKITQIEISKKITENITLKIDAHLLDLQGSITPTENVGSEEGSPIARVNGPLRLNIYLFEKLPQPKIINNPDGSITGIIAYVTYITPSMFESSKWVNKNGQIVIP